MWVTMSVMLSSDVLTRVGPNTRAKFLGSIWKRCQSYVNKQPVSIHFHLYLLSWGLLGYLILFRVIRHFL